MTIVLTDTRVALPNEHESTAPPTSPAVVGPPSLSPAPSVPAVAPVPVAPVPVAPVAAVPTLPPLPATLIVRPWRDAVIEANGHPPHSRYVELFWLSVLGPTATWLLRRLTDGLHEYPDGYVLELESTAHALGVQGTPTRTSPFGRALSRCQLFGTTHDTDDGIVVRQALPWLEPRQIARMPEHLKAAHHDWVVRLRHGHDPALLRRAEALADAMVWAGDPMAAVQRQLVLLGLPTSIAHQAAKAAARRAGSLR